MRLQRVLKPSVAATVLTYFVEFGITAIQGILLARLLGPTARGEFATAIFFARTLTFIGLMGTSFAVARRAANDAQGRTQLERSILRLGGVTGVFTILVVALVALTTLPDDKSYLLPLCVLCGLTLPLEQTRLLLLAVDQGSGNFRRYNSVHLVTSATFPLLLIVAWATGTISVVLLAVLSLVSPVVGLTLRFVLADAGNNRRSMPALSPLILMKEGFPYWISAAVCDLYGRLDQFLFLWLGSFAALGLYAAASPAAGMLLVGTEALSLFAFNAGCRQNTPMNRKELLHLGFLIASFQAILAAAFALLIGPLIILLYGQAFSGAIPFALALIPAQAINGFGKVIDGQLRGRGKVHVGIWARIAAAVLMTVTVILTFDRFQELSIPIAACLAHGLVAVTLAWFALADLPEDVGKSLVLQSGEVPT
jgi:O-antigen/teichoic acid export membrane protein